MIKTALFYIVTLVLFALARLTGFGQDKILSGLDRAAVLAFSETTMDNLFAGLTSNDYATFSRDFDSDMYERIPGTKFAAWKQELDHNFGTYHTRVINKVSQSDEFCIVVYQAKFEKVAQVMVTVVFHASDQTIASLSLDSEIYSWSAWE